MLTIRSIRQASGTVLCAPVDIHIGGDKPDEMST